jgi:hypothetical protein
VLVRREPRRGSTGEPEQHRAAAVLLFRTPVELDTENVEAAWRDMWEWRPPLHAEVDESRDDATLDVRGETTSGAVTFEPSRYPHDLAAAAEASPLWPGSIGPLDDVEHAVAHLDDPRSTLEAARWLTRVVATLATVTDVAGVLWDDRVLSRADTFLHMAKAEDGELPVELWTAVHPLERDGEVGMATTGLARFGHREIEAIDGRLDPADLRALVVGAARHVLKGNLLADGETIAGPGRRRFVVRRGEAVHRIEAL